MASNLEPSICLQNLDGSCTSSGCNDYHSTSRYQWQNLLNGAWIDIPSTVNSTLENAYANVNEDGVMLVGNDYSYADFDQMTVMYKNKSVPLRRLSTPSDQVSTHRYATSFIWYFLDERNQWIRYGSINPSIQRRSATSATSNDLEQAFCRNPNRVLEIASKRHNYSINFRNLTQTNKFTNNMRSIRRRPAATHVICQSSNISTVAIDSQLHPMSSRSQLPNRKGSSVFLSTHSGEGFPNYWKSMDGNRLILVNLTGKEDDYTRVQSMISNLQCSQILKMVRVQNSFLWKAFINRKDYLSHMYVNTNIQEMYLFHGTHKDHTQAICQENLDWRLHGTSSGHYFGKGTYFSNLPSVSDNYSRSNPKCLFVVKVLVGNMTKGSSNMVKPPQGCDTTVDNTSNPKIFVKYDMQEYYPEYYVEYTV